MVLLFFLCRFLDALPLFFQEDKPLGSKKWGIVESKAKFVEEMKRFDDAHSYS